MILIMNAIWKRLKFKVNEIELYNQLKTNPTYKTFFTNYELLERQSDRASFFNKKAINDGKSYLRSFSDVQIEPIKQANSCFKYIHISPVLGSSDYYFKMQYDEGYFICQFIADGETCVEECEDSFKIPNISLYDKKQMDEVSHKLLILTDFICSLTEAMKHKLDLD